MLCASRRQAIAWNSLDWHTMVSDIVTAELCPELLPSSVGRHLSPWLMTCLGRGRQEPLPNVASTSALVAQLDLNLCDL